MNLDATNPTFEEAYAETQRGYQAAGVDDADLSYLTREFFDELLGRAEQKSPPSRSSAGDTCAPLSPGSPPVSDLIHHVVFLGPLRFTGYRASSIGGCQMTEVVDGEGGISFVRKCTSGGASIFGIRPF
jgi:hypothetical protein